MMRFRTSFFSFFTGALLIGAASMGCVGGSKGATAEDKERLKAYIVDALPADVPNKFDINFENKIHLVGFKAEPALAPPGTEVKMTYYWRCDDTLDDGWRLFTHVEDELGNVSIANLDTNGPLREQRENKPIFAPSSWEKGKIYIDEQTLKVPDGVKGANVVVLLGIWKNDARLRVVSGSSDGTNRAYAGKVKTGIVPPPPEEKKSTKNDTIPELTATKLAAADKIVIDGKGDEKAWGGAPSTGPFVNVGTGVRDPSIPVQGGAKLLWDDAGLYAFFEVAESEFYADFKDAKSQPNQFTAAGQPKLWDKDTVELMIDPDGDGDNKDYYEIQINPQNKVFKSHFDTAQQPNGGENGPFGHEDWDPKLKSAVSILKDGDKTTGYTVELMIPWAGFHKAKNKPPVAGDVWRVNLYAMKNNGGVAWSPILGGHNFHYAPRFGRLSFFPKAPAAAASASASGSAAASAAPSASGSAPAPTPVNSIRKLMLPSRPTAAPPQ